MGPACFSVLMMAQAAGMAHLEQLFCNRIRAEALRAHPSNK